MDKAKGLNRITGLLFYFLILLLFSDACAIIRHPEDGGSNAFPHPPDNIIGKWGSNGSCVAIAPDLIITTCHQGGGVGTYVVIAGNGYRVSEVYRASVDGSYLDIRIAQLDEAELTEYAEIFTGDMDSLLNTELVIGGWGKDRGDPIVYGGKVCEYHWANQRSDVVQWCTNICHRFSPNGAIEYLVADFDGPDPEIDWPATTYEGIIAEYDSGGGWFVNSNGWKLVGLSAKVERSDLCRFRRYSGGEFVKDPDDLKAANTIDISEWILDYVESHIPNQSPYLTSPTSYSVTAGSRLNFTLYLGDPEGDEVAVECDDKPVGAAFDSSGRSFSWIPDYGSEGNYTAKFTADDGNGNSINFDIAITVAKGNRAPNINPIGDLTINETETLSMIIAAADPDGDTISYKLDKSPSGTQIDIVTGLVSWATGYEDAGEYEIIVSVSDGLLSVSSDVTVTVNNVNRAPEIKISGDTNPKFTAGLELVVSASDPDGDKVTLSVEDLPSGAKYSKSSGIVSWVTDKDDIGEYEIAVAATDGDMDDKENVKVTIFDDPDYIENEPPVFFPVSSIAVNEGEAILFAVQASDPDGDILTISVNGLPKGAVFVNNTFTWQTGSTDIGSHTVTFFASDSKDSTSMDVEIEVGDVNYPPVAIVTGSTKATAGDTILLVIEASDVDGDTLTYSLKSAPKGMSVDENDITWVTSEEDGGTYKFTVTVSDSENDILVPVTVTLATVSADKEAPFVVSTYPDNGSIQIPLNPLITVTIADYGDGIDYESMTITVDGKDIISGATIFPMSDENSQVLYDSANSTVYRTGNSSRYTFQYQGEDMFDYDYSPEVVVSVKDLNGNEMEPYSFSFTTEMFSMAAAIPVDESKSDAEKVKQFEPAIAVGDNDIVWSVWSEGEIGSRSINFAPYYNNTGSFDIARSISSIADMASADIAIDSSGVLYFVWQENNAGNWDIYAGKSNDGIALASKAAIAEGEDDQTSPVIAVSDEGKIYVTYVVHSKTGKDICFVELNSSLAVVSDKTIASNTDEQDNPVIACDVSGDIHVAWEDYRDGNCAVYAASLNGGWRNYQIVANAGEPDIAADSSGEYLHAAWSSNGDIFYSKLSLPLNSKDASPVNIIDDSRGALQESPSICHFSDGKISRTIVSWSDARNAIGNDDNDIYFASVDKASMTNILATVDSDLSCQECPVIASSRSGTPYILFRNTADRSQEVKMACATMVESMLCRNLISAIDGGCVGVPLEMVDSIDDVSISVPENALSSNVEMTIARVSNPPSDGQGITSLFSYDFGPSSTREFRKELTVVIPYPKQIGGSKVSVYWYNPQTGSYSQSGMSGIETININSQLNAVKFKTTHFSQYSVSSNFIPWITSREQ